MPIVLPLADLVRHVHRQRTIARMTQTELAVQAGVSQSFIAKLERGRLSPSYESVRAVVEALDRRASHDEATAATLMQRDPLWVAPDDLLGDAMERMKAHGYSQVPVVERGLPVGAVSETDILRELERGVPLPRLRDQPVQHHMREGFPTVAPDTRRRVLVELLRDHEAVLVLAGGRLKGVVTKSDLW